MFNGIYGWVRWILPPKFDCNTTLCLYKMLHTSRQNMNGFCDPLLAALVVLESLCVYQISVCKKLGRKLWIWTKNQTRLYSFWTNSHCWLPQLIPCHIQWAFMPYAFWNSTFACIQFVDGMDCVNYSDWQITPMPPKIFLRLIDTPSLSVSTL